MPEGPELHLSSLFIKRVSDSKSFIGKIIENFPAKRQPQLMDMNKRIGVNDRYTLKSWSRGKELMVAVKPLALVDSEIPYKPEEWTIRFNFGMTGCFKFTRTTDTPKHAKVCFVAAGEPSYTLSFVDMRGFGRWTATPEWSESRGPCILQEPDLFRAHVLGSLQQTVFSKPICEALLDQRYFNGVGNYLRAEALHRLGLRPFDRARDLLAPLPAELKVGRTDLLHMCHRLAAEVVQLGGGKRYDVRLPELDGQLADVKDEDDDFDSFEAWLQCYYQPGMKNLVDHNGRTVWFAGEPGPLVPKDRKARHGGTSKKSNASSKVSKLEKLEVEHSAVKRRATKKQSKKSKTPSRRADVKDTKAALTALKTKKTASKQTRTSLKNGASRARAESSDVSTNGVRTGHRRSQRLLGKPGKG